MPWTPILKGASKALASESVKAIQMDLLSVRDAETEPSLAGGAAGLAILYAYLPPNHLGADHFEAAHRCLENALAAVAENPTTASFYSGLAGVGWALAHLRDRLTGVDGVDDLAVIDAALLDHLDESTWPGHYDLVEGLVGFGVYALERLPEPAAAACLRRVVEHLAETSQPCSEGVTWQTSPAWQPPEIRADFPQGAYNLGLAHGVPGVIALLAQACAAGIAVGTARPVLEGAVPWLLAQQGTQGYPHWVGPSGPVRPGRLAWCYGDPGVATALLCAARCLDEPAWEERALAIALRAAERSPKEALVMDAGLCHGACGLGHLFNRMSQASGDSRLANAARFWFARALHMRRPGRGIGGYETWMAGEGDRDWVAEPGLLTGATGIALALLAAITPIEPMWDRMLLAAISPRAVSSRLVGLSMPAEVGTESGS